MWCPLPNKKHPQSVVSHKSPPYRVSPHGNHPRGLSPPRSPRVPINPSEREGEVNMLLQQYKSLTINLNKVRGRLYSLGVNPEN